MNRHERRARARRDDPQAACKAVENDVAGVKRQMRDIQASGVDVAVVDPDDDTSRYGDGDDTFIPIVIGVRGRLTAREAKRLAGFWCEIIKRHPKAIYYPQLLGYDDDPRELYEFEDVRLYLRQFAHFAGIAGPEAIGVETAGNFFVGLLAACGCAGFKHIVVTGADGSPLKPTTEQ